MTGRIEKSVFISYRRTNYWTALAVYQNLVGNGYDVFLDYKNIPSGDFEQVITENVKSRAHFIVILSPSALERCNEPGDWLRREIELAIETKRNIIPLLMEGFDFGSAATVKILTGNLASLKKYNGMGIPVEYFDEAMLKLRGDRFLNKPLETVYHPVSDITAQITEKQRSATSEAQPVKKEQLSAQEWYERGNAFGDNQNFNEAIRCYTESIRIQPDFVEAYYNRGTIYGKEMGSMNNAIRDFTEAIRLKSDEPDIYTNRGTARSRIHDLEGAYSDYDEAIHLKPDDVIAYSNRGDLRRDIGDLEGAFADLDKAIHLDPSYALAFSNRGLTHVANNDFESAFRDYNEAIRLKPDLVEAFNNRGVARGIQGDLEGALADFNEAIRLQPNFANAHYNRGLAHIRNNDLDTALTDYDEVIRFQPENANAYYNRASIWEAKKNYSSAIADYQKYLELSGGKLEGDQEEVEEKIKKLKTILTKLKPERKKKTK